MKALRWLSCHLVLLIVALALILLWFIRDELADDYARLTGTSRPAVAAGPAETVQPAQPGVAKDIPQPPAQARAPAGGPPRGPAQGWYEPAPVESPAAVEPFQADDVPVDNRSGPEPVPGQPAQAVAEPDMTAPSSMEMPAGEPAAVPGQQAPTMMPPPEQQPAMEASTASRPQPAPVMPPSEGVSALDRMFPPEDYDPESGAVDSGDVTDHLLPGSGEALRSGYEDFGAASSPPSQVKRPAGPVEHSGAMPMGGAPLPGQGGGDYQSRLDKARGLLWEGALDRAGQEYEALVRQYPDMPEPVSELGNLLLQQNRAEEARRAYEKAIVILRRQQRDNEAIGLIQFISRYNRDLADSLYNKYWQ